MKHLIAVIIGFGSGVVISGAVFAFIAIIGLVPRLAYKTGTQKSVRVYEEALIAGGIIGAVAGFKNFSFGLPFNFFVIALVIILGLCIGIFVGCLSMSLVEVLDVLPILTRRLRIKRGLAFFILAFALGKLMGSLLYFLIPGFYFDI